MVKWTNSEAASNTVAASIRKILGTSSLCALDIGARGDIPGAWLPLDGIAKVVAVEADEEAARRLRQKYASRGHGEYYCVSQKAVSRWGGIRTLYVTNTPSSSSLFDPDTALARRYINQQFLFPVRQHDIETTTLGAALTEQDVDEVHLIKMDIQGAEIEALEGLAPSHLSAVLAVETEVSMQEDKANSAPAFCDVHSWFLRHGFELFDLRQGRVGLALNGDRAYIANTKLKVFTNSPSISRRIWESDALYFKKIEVDVIPSEDMRRIMVLYCLYGFFAEAIEAAVVFERAGRITPSEKNSLENAVVAWHAAARRRWRYGVGQPAAALRWLIRYVDLDERPDWWPYD